MVSEADKDGQDKTRSFDVLSPGTIVSQYKITRKIGTGGMGEVYLAEDTRLHRNVALKFLLSQYTSDPDIKARFIREAQAAAALTHPNIITIHEVAEYRGRPYIAMEYVAGRSLKTLIGERELSTKEVIDITIQIGEGLCEAHEAGVIHRDIKPQNILIDKDGRIKISDFGLAKLRGAPGLTRVGTTFGTMAYMSPEQAQGMDVDQRADIFSLGVVIYEMITGQLPFKGDNEASLVNAVINQIPEPLARYKARVPEALQRVVGKALVKERRERYQHVDDLVADLRREKKSLEFAETTKLYPIVSLHSKRRLLRLLVPTAIVVAAVVLIFILEPFRVQMGPEKEAVARENTLAIMYFENVVDRQDPERLGEIVANLLITDLSESQYMNVVSSQRLYDILKLLGREGVKTVDRSVATEVATRAGSKWMLLGSILQIEPQFILTSQLVEVESGRVLASQRITGEPGETIFAMVDRLTIEVKEDLSLPAQAQTEEDPPVAEVTTHSPEAYRYYIEGQDYHKKIYTLEAERSYRKALESDSTFAMAYYRLAQLADGEEREHLIAKAVQYSDKVSQKEKHYIMSLDAVVSGDYAKGVEELGKIIELDPEDKMAHFWTGQYYFAFLRQLEPAVHHLNRAIEIDPLFKLAYNTLAYAYDDIGDFDKSIWAINQYISLVPDEANPYDSRADLYAYNGKIDQAIESYQKALEMKADFYPSLIKMGHMHLFKGEYAKAESYYKELSSSAEKDLRSAGRLLLAMIPVYQGKLDDGLEVLDNGIAADRMERAEGGPNAGKHFLKAQILERRNLTWAIEEIETAMEIQRRAYPGDVEYGRTYYVHILAQSGRFAEAQTVARQLKRDIEERNILHMYIYWRALGLIERSKGNLDAAITHLEKAAEEIGNPPFGLRYLLAETYIEAGRLGEAVAELESALSRYDENRATAGIRAVRAYYLLGLSYEKSGWNKKAAEKYEEFLSIWRRADHGIPEIEDARERLNQLKSAT